MHRELTDKTGWALVRSLLLVRDEFARPESEARLSAIWAASCLIREVGRDCRGEAAMQAVLRCCRAGRCRHYAL